MNIIATASPAPDPFSGLLPPAQPDVAADRTHREICLPDAPPFIASVRAGLRLRILELARAEGRLLMQVAAGPADEQLARRRSGPLAAGPLPGAEILVQRGTLLLDDDTFEAGSWLRQPLHGPQACARARLSADALLLVSIGQIAPLDADRRHRDAADPDAWLDGPTEGIEVLPLHGQGDANVMLMRWSSTVAFRPTLDPVGDEVFVLSGELHDSHASFGAGSWIRNPVPAWQSWAGTPGTRVCYKSGHFTAVPDDDFLRSTC